MDNTNANRLGEHVPRMYRVALRIVGDDDGAGQGIEPLPRRLHADALGLEAVGLGAP